MSVLSETVARFKQATNKKKKKKKNIISSAVMHDKLLERAEGQNAL
jgi:hypothetical protein